MLNQTAQLTIENRTTYHLPIIAGTTGEKTLDIRG